jgi:uncharacterized protein
MRRAPAAPPLRCGVGLKPSHYAAILERRPDVGFFEVHAENYMGDGGPPHRYLEAIRASYPISVHGVGLSIGGARPLDRDHLARLARLVGRYDPCLVSEHLAWSAHEIGVLNDLLPLPYTEETLAHVVRQVDAMQTAIGRHVLLENPATYLRFAHSPIPEPEFLAEVARRSGCGLLLDVTNVYVSSVNHGLDPLAYLDGFPFDRVEEIHLAGFGRGSATAGRPLLIDTHGCAVAPVVWSLYSHVVARLGPVPSLVEWDNDIPAWDLLHAEAERAEREMRAASPADALAAGGDALAL